ncbi:VWA domain-containing protein [Aestuariirhabdus sp. Z084]|uniref:VWA domain-containing protein n=1 Tax=Aestuariirhabdus haliotis TaxID=2918751 RepID=UPI00201B3D1B|nr:VWA domain-containing protein [Aestuariirhabdus haliotis]MCL6414615.1 VWA domain-containing protein [Aestuariirhabdus haliotis]MCL6418403.1 VWA domain-containing protein [Aestuariirhabdus haliotis]
MNLPQLLTDFHFIRPFGLLLLPLGLAILWLMSRLTLRQSAWSRVIPDHLLHHLQKRDSVRAAPRQLRWLILFWVLASTALSGPSWQKLPSPVYKNDAPLVIVLDLSWSMYATDLSPDRLTRARRKVHDIINSRVDGTTALVAYAGDAYRVAPLTDDRETITNLLSVLEPALMPLAGSQTSQGIRMAVDLLGETPSKNARILLLTDEISAEENSRLQELFANHAVPVSIIGVGTPQGAPIRMKDGGFLRDTQGAIVIPRLDKSGLESIARNLGGRYATIRVDQGDWNRIQPALETGPATGTELENQRFDQWSDQGYWLVLPLLILVLVSFRKGWLLTIALPLLILPSEPSYALDWQSLWQTPDQQGNSLLKKQEAEKAAETFTNQDWKGYAYFEAGEYESAAKAFGAGTSLESQYNRGNAEALSGNLEQALELYDQVLKQQPEHKAALKNRDIIRQLLEQAQQEQNSSGQGENDKDKDKANKDENRNQEQGSNGSPENQQGEQSEQTSDSGQEESDQDQSQNKNSSSAAQPDNESTAEQQQESTGKQDTDADTKNERQPDEENANITEQSQKNNALSTEDESASDAANATAETMDQADISAEDQQAMEGWLRRIEDDPSGLLRRKFEIQHRQRGPQQAGEKAW